MLSSSPLQLPLLLLLPAAVLAGSLALNDKQLSRQKRFIPSEVCYEGIGCFSTGGNFYDILIRPIQLVPQSPERIRPTFELYSRSNLLRPQYIVYNQRDTVRRSNFDSKKETKVVTHGFLEDTSERWMHEMKKALLLKGDYNVIMLDWSRGNQLPYTQATSNTRVVGALLGQLLEWLEKDFGARAERVHILGHSLGSHIAGYAGHWLKGRLGRITGMDPAGPYFENTHEEVRLDPGDAKFVDVVHTDGDSLLSSIKLEGGFGLMQPLGHVDFYPNGGRTQPDCNRNPIVNIIIDGIIDGTKWTIACHHMRVLSLVTNTILHPEGDYMAVPCGSYEEFKAGRCNSCGKEGCAMMGMQSAQWKRNGRKEVKMFLDTAGSQPYEMHHYVVRLTISGIPAARRQYGDIYLTLEDPRGRTTSQLTVVSKSYMEPGEQLSFVVTNLQSVHDIQRIRFSWRQRRWVSITTKYLHLNRVEIFEPYKNARSLFCGRDRPIESRDNLWLVKANYC